MTTVIANSKRTGLRFKDARSYSSSDLLPMTRQAAEKRRVEGCAGRLHASDRRHIATSEERSLPVKNRLHRRKQLLKGGERSLAFRKARPTSDGT
jgi:hypothetical protein